MAIPGCLASKAPPSHSERVQLDTVVKRSLAFLARGLDQRPRDATGGGATLMTGCAKTVAAPNATPALTRRGAKYSWSCRPSGMLPLTFLRRSLYLACGHGQGKRTPHITFFFDGARDLRANFTDLLRLSTN